MILWGTEYPKIQLRQSYTNETIATGDGSTLVFDYDALHKPIAQNITNGKYAIQISYTIGGTTYHATDYYCDGHLVGGNLDYNQSTVDYTTGHIHLVFTTAPDNGTVIQIDTYEVIEHEYVFSSSDGLNLQFGFKEETLYDITYQTGKREKKVQYRPVFILNASEYGAYTQSDFLRMLFGWPAQGRRIVVYPRPGNLGGYEMLPEGDFTPEYPQGLWIGMKHVYTLVGVYRYDTLPPHTGDGGDI